MCLRRPSLNPGPNARNKVVLCCPPGHSRSTAVPVHGASRLGVQVRTRVVKPGSCSPTALSFLQALRSSAGRAASSWGPPVVPTVPLAASAVVWTPHTRVPSPWVTTGRGRRARRSPNARLQSFLGSAVGSAKCLRQRPGPSGEGPGETEPGAVLSLRRASEGAGERKATGSVLGGNECGVVMLCLLRPAIRICPSGVHAVWV